jgi:malonyl-CoA/methylmalonyl-CoA synthetase
MHVLPLFHVHGLFAAINTVLASGSAPLPAETHHEFLRRTGHAILERYGMTETLMNTSNPFEGVRKPGSVGVALPGIAIRVADPATGACAGQADTIGALEVAGPNVFAGYWHDPEKTRAEFTADGWFKTGDLGRIDRDGYVHIVGRAKDLVISGGYNVYPKEVELELDAQRGIAESAVFGIPHPDFGEGVTAVVVPKPGTALSEADIINALRKMPCVRPTRRSTHRNNGGTWGPRRTEVLAPNRRVAASPW